MPTRRGSSSSAALRNAIGATVATANQRPSTSSASRTVARRRGRAGLRFCGRRCGRGGRPSCGSSKSYCGNACTRPSRKQGAYLRSVLLGHIHYYGVPMNGPALGAFAWQWGICGGKSCADAVRATTCRGTVWNVLLLGGFRLHVSVILIPSCVCTSSPKVGAGCGNPARPDLWRGL